DGIRDFHVTGVQTCALPISLPLFPLSMILGVFEVKATNGDTFLGGEDFDNVLLNYMIDEFKKKEGIDLRTQPLSHQRLKETAEADRKSTRLNSSHVKISYAV